MLRKSNRYFNIFWFTIKKISLCSSFWLSLTKQKTITNLCKKWLKVKFLTRHFILNCLSFQVRALCFVESWKEPNTISLVTLPFIIWERVWLTYISHSLSQTHTHTHTHTHSHSHTVFFLSLSLSLYFSPPIVVHNFSYFSVSFCLSPHTHTHTHTPSSVSLSLSATSALSLRNTLSFCVLKLTLVNVSSRIPPT